MKRNGEINQDERNLQNKKNAILNQYIYIYTQQFYLENLSFLQN